MGTFQKDINQLIVEQNNITTSMAPKAREHSQQQAVPPQRQKTTSQQKPKELSESDSDSESKEIENEDNKNYFQKLIKQQRTGSSNVRSQN